MPPGLDQLQPSRQRIRKSSELFHGQLFRTQLREQPGLLQRLLDRIRRQFPPKGRLEPIADLFAPLREDAPDQAI